MSLARLQLALGPAASVIQELPSGGGCRLFAARAPHEDGTVASRLVVLHPSPPAGPPAGALLDRMASIHAVAHPGLAPLLATGELDGAAWAVEPTPPRRTVASRAAERGGLSTGEAIAALRQATRALVALHRRNLSHGALSADAIGLDSQGVTLHHLGRSVSFDPQADWRMLGCILRDAGVAASAGRHQRFPPELVDLVARMAQGAEPIQGDAVLALLDRFPTGSPVADGLLDGAGHGARHAADRHTLVVTAVAGLLVLLWFLLR